MEWIRMLGICLLTALLVAILRQINPSVAGLLCAALGTMILCALLPQIHQYVDTVRRFMEGVGLGEAYYATMMRAVGIVLITQITEQICRDMGAQQVAERVEMCGRVAMLGMAIPLFIELTQMAVDVLR